MAGGGGGGGGSGDGGGGDEEEGGGERGRGEQGPAQSMTAAYALLFL